MLKQLSIKNYALIQSLEIHPDRGLNTITGETGAGKSIMLGAIGLLLGNRADTKTLLNSDEKCVIEGHFDVSQLDIKPLLGDHDLDYEPVTVIRREITPSGKSRSFVNDTPARLDALRDLGAQLIDVHSQHETLLMKGQDFQLRLIDTFAETTSLLAEYKGAFTAWQRVKNELNQALLTKSEATKELDYNQFLLNELEEAQLDADELGAAEEELQLLENAEDIKTHLAETMNLLTESDFAAQEQLHTAASALDKASSLASKYEGLAQRLNGVLQEVKDIGNEVLHEEANVEFNEERASELRERINLINSLLQKHQVHTIPQLILIRDELREKVTSTLDLDEKISELEKSTAEGIAKVRGHGDELSQAREASFEALATQMVSLLNELGMPDATVEVRNQRVEPTSTGLDDAQILFSANKGVAPKEMAQVASGGETSRLMFVSKHLLASKSKLPTLIFDEIDTGISGEVAIKMGQLMKSMANHVQLISITHLPQIAGLGNAHFFVFKDSAGERTISKMKQLSEEERVQSIAEMIGGQTPSESAFQSARELLSVGG